MARCSSRPTTTARPGRATCWSEPACRVDIGGRHFNAVAEPLEGADHNRAIAALILRYGTPAEKLGHGPSFRLRPVADESS